MPTIDADPVPIALLPVRLETRFRDGNLLIRIYPDTVHVDTHEPPLAPNETAALQEYVADTQGADDDGRKAAWRKLARRFGPQRAAWIVQTLATPPTPATRPATWTRAPWTTVAPDQWLALGYVGDSATPVLQAWSNPVTSPLHTGPDPSIAGATGADASMQWLVDFQAALAAGMAIQAPLAGAAAGGLDLLLVVGVAARLGGNGGRDALRALLDAHHYTNGIGFVLEETPTNNTPDAPSGFTSLDASLDDSFDVELHDQIGPRTDPSGKPRRPYGVVAAEALGLDPAVFSRVTNAGAASDLDPARADMNKALWPATLGYFLTQLLVDPAHPELGPTSAAIENARDHFVRFVRGCGELPLLRIGPQPYGLLPATPLDLWAPSNQADTTASVVAALRGARSIRPFWEQSVANVPRVGGGDTSNDEFLTALSVQPRSLTVELRNVLGGDYAGALYRFMGKALNAGWRTQQATLTAAPPSAVGLPTWSPRIRNAVLAQDPFAWRGPIAQANAQPGQAALSPNYLAWLSGSPPPSYRNVRDDTFPSLPQPRPLLYLLSRASLLLTYVRRALERTSGETAHAALPEQELLDVDVDAYFDGASPPGRPWTPWDLLDYRDPAAPAGVGRALDTGDGAALGELRASLANLSTLPPAELERLTLETLDLCSHRLDAWLTSIAARRLRELRAAGNSALYLGSYGWVEEVRPATSQPESAGFVHAPSPSHAAAAAVLAGGFLSHRRTGDAGALALDLSSERVRKAMSLVEAVHDGRSPAALLGARFERALQERGVAQYVAPFRAAFPLTGKTVGDAASAAEAVADPVVDGAELQRRWVAADRTPAVFGTSGWPAVTADTSAAVVAALATIDDTVDAYADLMLAESVYHLVRGESARAAAAAAALAGGPPPHEVDVVRTPRSGLGVTHRVVTLLPAAGAPDPSPRAAAEPRIAAWARQLVGNLANVVAGVQFLDARGAPLGAPQRVLLAQVRPQLSPIDVVYGADELPQRVLYHALRLPNRPAAAASAQLVDTSMPGKLPLAAAQEIGRAARALLAGARALTPADLVLPEAPPPQPPSATVIATRAAAALALLHKRRDDLQAATQSRDAEQLRQALLGAAALGVAAAVPVSAGGASPDEVDALAAQAAAVRTELERRLADAAQPPQPGTSPLEVALAQLRAVFGDGFLVLPPFAAGAGGFDLSFARSAALQRNDPTAATRWLHRVARVRTGVGRLSDVLTYAEAAGSGDRLRFSVDQLPAAPGDLWCADSFGAKPPVGRVSLVAHATGNVDRTAVAGIVADEWTEVVPRGAETTAVAIHAHAPTAAAPQAILLATPPNLAARWTADSLAATVRQTHSLARMRAVDRDALGALGQYLPAIYLAFNVHGQTVSTDMQNGAGVPLSQPVAVAGDL